MNDSTDAQAHVSSGWVSICLITSDSFTLAFACIWSISIFGPAPQTCSLVFYNPSAALIEFVSFFLSRPDDGFCPLIVHQLPQNTTPTKHAQQDLLFTRVHDSLFRESQPGNLTPTTPGIRCSDSAPASNLLFLSSVYYHMNRVHIQMHPVQEPCLSYLEARVIPRNPIFSHPSPSTYVPISLRSTLCFKWSWSNRYRRPWRQSSTPFGSVYFFWIIPKFEIFISKRGIEVVSRLFDLIQRIIANN
jgi:hypothetical protein